MRIEFNTAGQFYAAVVQAALHPGQEDARLRPLAAAPTAGGSESVGSDGGYLVPPTIGADVKALILGESSLLGRTDRQTSKSNSYLVPADAGPAWATTGPQASVEGDGQPLLQSKLALQGRTLKLYKIQSFVPVTNELLEDGASGLAAYLRQVVPARIGFRIDDLLINGDGVAKPLGFVKSGAKITQTKEGAQAAATVNLANTQKMVTRLHAACLPNAVWLAHPETMPQLSALGFPHYAPAGVSGGPLPRLHGIPVLYREACAPLGTEGDLILADPTMYLSVVREEFINEQLSVHVFFDADSSAFRFTTRIAGAPWLAAPVTRYRTATTISSIVTLETR